MLGLQLITVYVDKFVLKTKYKIYMSAVCGMKQHTNRYPEPGKNPWNPLVVVSQILIHNTWKSLHHNTTQHLNNILENRIKSKVVH